VGRGDAQATFSRAEKTPAVASTDAHRIGRHGSGVRKCASSEDKSLRQGILIETSIAVTFRRDVRSMAATASSAEAASLVNHGRAWTI
jgi:hypothetical protein